MNKPKILVFTRWQKLNRGFSKIISDLYSTFLWQEKFDIYQYAFSRPTNLQDEIEDFDISTFSESSENRLHSIINSIQPNIILFMGDPIFLQKYSKILETSSAFKIAYIFIDGKNIPFTWKNILLNFDMIVSATNFGKKEFEAFQYDQGLNINKITYKNFPKNIEVINPPVNSTIYYPIEEIRRNAYRNLLNFNENDFIITNVCVNTLRKGIEYSIEFLAKIYQELKNTPIKPKMILHTQFHQETMNLLRYFDLPDKCLSLSSKEKTNVEMARIYKISDLVINTSVAEGWGLPLTEAMACGTPVLAPAHSGIIGAIGAETTSLKTNSLREELFTYETYPFNNYIYNSQCPIISKMPNINSLIKKTKRITQKDKKSLSLKENIQAEAIRRTEELCHKNIAQQWLNLFEEITTYQSTFQINIQNTLIPNINFNEV